MTSGVRTARNILIFFCLFMVAGVAYALFHSPRDWRFILTELSVISFGFNIVRQVNAEARSTSVRPDK